MFAAVRPAQGEAMLELFNVNWSDLTKKMPELAEAGYTSLWVPNPAKAESGGYSVGYDLFDPFDLGDKNQMGTTATRYGTKAQLLQMVETAHRFGIRVYFDNVMNHRAFSVPGNSGTPTNYYPGLVPQDFHVKKTGANSYENWPSIGANYMQSDWGDQWIVQYRPLVGLIDLANEPGSVNGNFGSTMGSTLTKPSFVRQPNNREYYMDNTKPAIEGSFWHPFNGTNGVPVSEDVNSYLIRAVLWELNETKCDGFRLDAVKHVKSEFFGDTTATFNGYIGAVQAMFDYVHGYGTNVLGNGYFEGDDCRNSCFDTETPRNDALMFGEHLGSPPSYGEYITHGMRLLNSPLRDKLNGALGGGDTLAGMEQRDYTSYFGAFRAPDSVMFGQSHDASGCCATKRDLQNAYYFMHEGIPEIYSDGWNQSGAPSYFPTPPYANYLGETSGADMSGAGPNSMPDICYLHNQLARGGTSPRWGDYNVVAFERYDYRESSVAKDQAVVLFAMNDKASFPGDVTFDDGVGQSYDGYYGGIAISNSKGQGLVVGFPPGSVLVQLASSSPTAGRAYQKLLVHAATTSLSAAQADSSRTNVDAAQRLVYVGSQTLAPGGGAIELNLPSGSWVMYGYQWPEPSRANPATNAIVFRQGGAEAPRITIYRTDGTNSESGYNPIFPFKMRGGVDAFGNVIGGVNVSNRTYAIDVPIVTNGNFDILLRSDASCGSYPTNLMMKLDGGIDLNSQMGLGPLSGGVGPAGADLRDNKPGIASDVYLGYEQMAFQFRNGPEKFAAKNTASNNLVSLGAETYYYTVGGGSNIVTGSGIGKNISNGTCYFNYHDPVAANTATNNGTVSQRVPLSPTGGQAADIYFQVGDAGQINTCYIYYTTDGTNPEGAFGMGKGTTQVVPAFWVARDSGNITKEWWKGTIPGQAGSVQVRYKIGAFNGGSYGFSVGNTASWPSSAPISDAESSGAKYYGLTQGAITNFNPTTAVVWLHNDLNTNNTSIGLKTGFHIVRGKVCLPRAGQSSVFNTFSQTFYYDGALPGGVVAYPVANGNTISNQTYSIVIRADSSVNGVDCNIQDGSAINDDLVTGQANGNGTNALGQLVFASATSVSPNATISAQYTNYPQEYRFTYANVPSSGTATITLRLKGYTTSIYPNRYTTLTRTVNTVAPTQVVNISNPSTDGAVITLTAGDPFAIQTCFSTNLPNTTSTAYWSIYVNGAFQPRTVDFVPTYFIGGTACGSGMKLLSYNCNSLVVGSNTIQVVYNNGITLSDTKTVIIAPPLVITGLANNNQQLNWDSALGINYQVLATTNLTEPFQPISGIIPGQGTATHFYDPNPLTQKFYQIQVVP